MEGLYKKISALFASAFVFMFAASAHAQGLVPCKGLDCKVGDIFRLFANIFNFLIGLSAVVAVLFLVLSGFRMLIAYWSEQPESEIRGAKDTFRRAVFGLIIILTAYLLVNTVLGVLGAGSIEEYFGNFGAN